MVMMAQTDQRKRIPFVFNTRQRHIANIAGNIAPFDFIGTARHVACISAAVDYQLPHAVKLCEPENAALSNTETIK